MLTAKVAINSLIKQYGDSQRNSSAYGTSITLKEKLNASFCLKEGYVFEKNDANSAFFSYNGNSFNIWGGYLVLPKTTALLGYNYLVRDYDEPVGFKITANTISMGLEYEFREKWFIGLQYDHQASDSNVIGTNTSDNIFSLGVRYSY
jgi:hypothetical protein